jgi:hypothetical protein
MLHLCTYFDVFYLHRGIALYESLARHLREPFTMWILCFDQKTFDILSELNLPNVGLIHRDSFEAGDHGLGEARSNRSRIEYYWTCTPSLPLYIFKNNEHVRQIIYLDADYYFYNSATAIRDLGNGGSILIIPHDYSPGYTAHDAGKYNVGVMMFHADRNGLECLEWWRDRCIEWCYWRHEDDKIGDQGYLNGWPQMFQGVVVSDHFGINAAPWNINNYELSLDQDEKVLIAGRPLICYHFHACRFYTSRLVSLAGPQVHLCPVCLSSVYRPYLKDLLDIENELDGRGFDVHMPRSGIPWRYLVGVVARKRSFRSFMWVRP